MKIAVGQINLIIGALDYNTDKIIRAIEKAKAVGAELIVFPELALTGYPPKDLLLRKDFLSRVQFLLNTKILEASAGIGVVLGAPLPEGDKLANVAIFIVDGEIIYKQNKTLLPNYDVFDENRYFEPAQHRQIITYKGQKIGLTVCEDAWNDKDFWNRCRYDVDPIQELVAAGAQLIINISASPYHYGKQALREEMLTHLAHKHNCNFLYVNQVGGNDDLIFDGASVFVHRDTGVIYRGRSCHEDFFVLDSDTESISSQTLNEDISTVYEALVIGIRDYLHKTGFEKAIIGLSGGIDSAVTAALAVAALGKENVFGVAMPSRYSSEGSVADARELAENLEINFEVVAIESVFAAFLGKLNSTEEMENDLAEENIQARIRGNILMFKSNRHQALLLSTGNKSETAVGYTTLYGDMCGGLAVISDLPKTFVYQLAAYINKSSIIIPKNTIIKPPSAELRPDQVDQDSLPPYEELDAILKAYVEDNKSLAEICDLGFSEKFVRKILNMVDRNEYKRRQAATGLRITTKAFGSGRRMPIAQGWKN